MFVGKRIVIDDIHADAWMSPGILDSRGEAHAWKVYVDTIVPLERVEEAVRRQFSGTNAWGVVYVLRAKRDGDFCVVQVLAQAHLERSMS